MKKLLTSILFLALIACKKEPTPIVCPGGCDAEYYITSPNAQLDPNNHWHIPFVGLNYFTIRGILTPLDSEYVINGEPLVEAKFDSDYWIILDTVHFTTPMYSYLGWWSDNNYMNPIAVGNHEYNMVFLANNYMPINMAGYQLHKYMCWDCPYTPTLLGTYSKYTYEPGQNFIYDNEMIGDTAHIFIKTTFNTDLGARKIVETKLNVIFE